MATSISLDAAVVRDAAAAALAERPGKEGSWVSTHLDDLIRFADYGLKASEIFINLSLDDFLLLEAHLPKPLYAGHQPSEG